MPPLYLISLPAQLRQPHNDRCHEIRHTTKAQIPSHCARARRSFFKYQYSLFPPWVYGNNVHVRRKRRPLGSRHHKAPVVLCTGDGICRGQLRHTEGGDAHGCGGDEDGPDGAGGGGFGETGPEGLYSVRCCQFRKLGREEVNS